ncbi:MAG: porin [Fibromonadales bacterium]|nr:porin [Fibromonadales bacterium]
MLRGNNGLKILLVLLLGSIGAQTVYAKKDKEKNAAPKDSTIATVVVAEDTTVVKVEKKTKTKTEAKAKTEAKSKTKPEPKEETEIKVDGIMEIGFDNSYKYVEYKAGKRVEYKRIGRAEVGASFRPVKKVRAEIGFEYNSKDSVPAIDKLYTQYNPFNFSTIRFGYMKKSFGLEERTGLDERYFHKRSIINDSLEYFGFLDHDLTLQYRHEIGKKLELRGGFSWTKDSTRYLQNYSIEYDDKKNNLILAAIIRHYFPPDKDKDAVTTFISSLSYRHIGNLSASEVELTYGSNPAMKSYYDEDATIFGARLKENIFLNTGLNTLHQVIPVGEMIFYSSDFKGFDDFDTQLRAGLTLGFAKKSAIQWRNNYGVVSKIRDSERELWRRRFDTEVVVIF